jgi:hypothetical protein
VAHAAVTESGGPKGLLVFDYVGRHAGCPSVMNPGGESCLELVKSLFTELIFDGVRQLRPCYRRLTMQYCRSAVAPYSPHDKWNGNKWRDTTSCQVVQLGDLWRRNVRRASASAELLLL